MHICPDEIALAAPALAFIPYCWRKLCNCAARLFRR